MGRSIFKIVAVSLVGLTLYGCKFEQTVSGRRDFSVDPTIEYKQIALEDLIRHPSSNKGLEIEFMGMFYRRDESIWNHFYTPFTQDDFSSFSMWPMNTRVWDLSGRLGSIATLYMHKNNPYMQNLIDAQPYSIALVRGKVMSDYEGRAWVLVNHFDVEQSAVFSGEALSNLVAGLNHKAEGRPASAIFSLEAAIKGTMSEEGFYAADMALGELYEGRNDYERAIQHFSAAETHRSGDAAARTGRQRNEKFLERQRMIEEGREPEEKKSGQAEDWQRKYEGAQTEIAALKAKNEALEAENKRLGTTGGAGEELQKTKDALLKSEADRAKLGADLEAAKKSAADSSAATAKANEEKAALDAEVKRLKEDLAKAGDAAKTLAEREATIKELQSAGAQKDESIKTLTAERDDLKAKAAGSTPTEEVKKMQAAWDAKAKLLNDTVEALRKEIDDLKKDN